MAITWKDLGIGTAGKAVGGVIDSAFGALQNYQNYRYGEMAADKADQRQRQQFKDMYSIEAQMQQLKNAGLSPSMFFGGTPSQGGATAPQGNGASGPIFNSSPIDMLTRAQVENIKSQTNLNNAEANNLDQDTKNKGQELLNLVQEFENNKVQHRLLVATAEWEECNAQLAWDTFQANLEAAYYNTKKMNAEARSAEVKADLDESTFDACYQMAWAELDAKLSDAALNRSEIGLTKAQVKEIGWNIWQTKKEQIRKDKQFNQDINNMKNEVKLELMKLNQGAERISADVSMAKINAVAHIVGSLFNLGGTAFAATTRKEIATMNNKNQPKGKTETTIEDSYDAKGNLRGKKIRSRHSNNNY